MSRSVSRSTFPSITPNAGKSFGSEYQAWWKKTHGKFLDDHLQALVDTARPIPVVHLEGSGKVCKNKVLNIGMPSSLGAKVLQKRKIESQLSSITPKMKTPTQAAYVSKRLLQDESESSNNEENNIATPQREKSQDSGEYLSCSYLMKPPPVTQVKKRLPYVSYNEVKDDLGYEAHKHTLTSMSIFDRKKVILDTQKDFTSTFLGCY
ncbi:hypothetical protein KY290_036413 [Solanum tuberosum]|uniref:Uncharacterized protein n=1 Tax=Solanum tuberosum TaxID=4113 RepID=A0ABQ7TU54_SOLTU|nr:hypothetical protein KY285_035718 [Solanum tuberosum]KAH0737708.1 hypothetical protein KY290_036413 [Solanum tuberosum]